MTVSSQFLTGGQTFAVDTQKRNFQEITSPAEEPVTTAEVKTFARIVTASEDSLITSLITVARIAAEKYCGRAFVGRDFEMFLDHSPLSSVVELPLTPVSAIAKISSFTEDDTETTFDATEYRLDSVSTPSRVVLKNAATWPTGLRNSSALRFEFTAGYGAAAADVPDPIKTAVKIITVKLWELRGQIEDGSDTGIASIDKLVGRLPIDAVMILGPFRVRFFE